MDTTVLRDAVAHALHTRGINEPDVRIEPTSDLSHGDVTTNVALMYAKELKVTPKDAAEAIVSALPPLPGVANVTIAGPGFINFTYTAHAVFDSVSRAISNDETWGEGDLFEGQHIMVEHTQPNPFKVFHIGHLMSNTIGEALVCLCESQGARVVRANYQGDVGPHVAKALWGVVKLGLNPSDADDLGRAYAAGSKAYDSDPQAKSDIEAINKAVYEGADAEISRLYAEGRKTSLARFEDIYRVLGSTFDRYYFESETASLGKSIVEAHPEVFELSDGARVFKGEQYGLHTRVFINSQGLPTYEAKEIGLEHLKEKEYPECDVLLITTAVEQKAYFDVVKKAIECIHPALAQKLVHVSHGMMRLPSGKMSSRTGDVVTGESLVLSLIERALERAKESRAENHEALAQMIAVGAIKFQILKQATGKDTVFEEARALSLEGDSGPYIQYAHARCVSLLLRGAEALVEPRFTHTEPPHVLERLALRLPLIVERAAGERAPQHLANFLIEVASAFNTWYAQDQILGTADAAHKLARVAVVRSTLAAGLGFLGIPAPEKM